MSIWAHNPEYFDNWLEQEALDGRFGSELQQMAEKQEFLAWDYWEVLDKDGKLGAEAMQSYVESFIP